MSEEVLKPFLSGMFEGEILGEKVTLHSERKSFNEDNAFVGFCTTLEVWLRKHGEKYLDEISEAQHDKRYQKLGLQSLDVLKEAILTCPAFAEHKKVLESFATGSVGDGHSPLPEKSEIGPQTEKSISIQGGFTTKDGDGSSDQHVPATTNKPGHLPFTATGPHGKHRTLVKHDSVGLQFSYDKMEGSDRLWMLDTKQGILHFNVHHPLWVSCDVSDRKIRQLQETIALNALIIEAMPGQYGQALQYAFDETLPALLHLYHASTAFNFLQNRTQSNKK